MKIAICSTIVPFIDGGGRFIVKWLAATLRMRGHQVEEIYLPFSDHPDILMEQIMGLRLLEIGSSADRLIALRPPSYVLPHENKVLWFIHHIRIFYDLWDHAYNTTPKTPAMRSVRAALMAVDNRALCESRQVFTNSHVVGNRLRKFNGIESQTLYPPIFEPERFGFKSLGDEILYFCRVEHHKRQHLAVEAMKHVKTPVRLRICGSSIGRNYPDSLKKMISDNRLESKVTASFEWISEVEKADAFSHCLAAIYIPLDEDSYGYTSLEASHSSKAVITTHDSGGVLELVEHENNGLVCEPTPEALAECFDRLYENRRLARELGCRAEARVRELNITWDHVVERLLS
ncbi:MAG: glycosyltransferase family 4 protein [Armatimonadetes bacterium]|nr:glycosyltransferase family 4 protein [Akkermansiaceae bacterium]